MCNNARLIDFHEYCHCVEDYLQVYNLITSLQVKLTLDNPAGTLNQDGLHNLANRTLSAPLSRVCMVGPKNSFIFENKNVQYIAKKIVGPRET